MPRGTHPNSLENLKKGHRFTSADDSARKNAIKSQAARRSIQEEMLALIEETDKSGNPRSKALAAKLMLNMEKSPEWYKLGLRMLGQLPPEQVEISKPKEEIAEDIEAALSERRRERNESRTT